MGTSYEIDLMHKQYQDNYFRITQSDSYLPALKAAILAPSIFLKNIQDFEATFDSIIHHLELALSKAKNEFEAQEIKRIAQELFHCHIYMIEQKINYLKALANQHIGQKIKTLFTGNSSIAEPPFQLSGNIIAITTQILNIQAASFITEYFQRLYAEWKVDRKSLFFYVQLARTYRKIVASNIYSKQFSLINNTIDRNKFEIIRAIVNTNEWDEGVEFIASLEHRKPFHFSMLKSQFYRGYRKYFMKRNLFSTYLFFCALLFLSVYLIILCVTQAEWSTTMKTMSFFAILFLAVFFGRYEHRLIPLKIRIRQKVKEISIIDNHSK
jgi:hypothetical protein